MNSQTQRKVARVPILLGVGGSLLLSLCLCGLPGLALGSDSTRSLQIEADRVTGQLTHVTLRRVLDQFHEQLGIDYVASETELDQFLSVELHNEPLSSALAKILAPWDYAFTTNKAGHLQTLYVMAKAPSEVLQADRMAKGRGSDIDIPKDSDFSKHGGGEPRFGLGRENQRAKKASISEQPTSTFPAELKTMEGAGMSASVTSTVAVPMEISPPGPGSSMQILPVTGEGMQITPGDSAATMEIIPSTSYLPMEIQPVPEHVQQEMLRSLNP